MARRGNDEYAGTDEPVAGTTGPIDPATLAGNGSGDSGAGDGDDAGDDDDIYQRNAAGGYIFNRDGSRRKKRGRKRGGSGGRKGTARGKNSDDLKASVDALANVIAVAHLGIAGITRTPEMALDDSEAQLLAQASVPVLDQFNFVPDPRFTAIFGLVVAAGQVYGPRYILIRERKGKEAQDKRASNAKPVHDAQPTAAQPAPFQPDLTATLNGQ